MREQLIDTEGVPEDESWLIEDALILVGAESKAVQGLGFGIRQAYLCGGRHLRKHP